MVSLSYSEAGAGAPIVLLHAFPLSRVMYRPTTLALAPTWRVVTPDLRGFGESPLAEGEGDPSVDAMADDVVALLDALDVPSAWLGGLSMGGYVAMSLLRRHPTRVDGLLLMDTKATADSEEARGNRHALAERAEREGSGVLAPMIDALLGETTRATRPDVVELVQEWMRVVPGESIAYAQRAMAARPDSMATLESWAGPAVVLVGEEDTLSPVSDAEAMSHALGVSPIVVPGAGHLSVVEQPERTCQALAAALRAAAEQHR